MEERVVGDFFDDRKADGFIRNSILEVHRYPPKPDLLETLQRFSSLAPTSSARPSKRPLELPSQSYPSQNSQNLHREIPSIEEEWDAETVRPFGTAAKRQRTQGPTLNGTSGAHQLFGIREERGGGQYYSSQTTGTQESIHQVPDSQKSPRKKRTSWSLHHSVAMLIYNADINPYGTPTSLPLLGPQELTSGNEIDLSAIPDSPLGRERRSVSGAVGGAIQLDRESTKSESPELRASVHEVPPVEPIDASGEKSTTDANSPKSSTTPFISNATSHLPTISQIVDKYAGNHGLGARQIGDNAADISRTPNHRPSIENQVHAQTARSSSKNSHKSDPVFDPIESDTESFHEKQQMQSAKRLRSSKTPTASFRLPRGSNNAGVDRKDGQFLVPSVPQLRTNGAHISKEVEGQQEKDRIKQKKAEEKRSAQETIARENAAEKEAAERKANQERLANQKAAEEEKARVEELAQAKKAKLKEEELAEAKRVEASRVDAARLAEEKKTSERLAREREARETALAEEAKKMMLAADGAKQIEAEKQEKEKARLREVAAKRQADEAKAAEQAREAQGKDYEKKERLSRDKPQQLAASESKDAKQRTHQAGSAQETATAVKERYQKRLADTDAQKLRESSEVQSRSSTTTSASRRISGLKRSMTPMVPGTSATKSSYQSSLGSSPSSSRSSGNMDAPLRSALRQSSSAVPRSVSSVSFDVPPQAKLNEYIDSTPDSKSLKAINNERTTKQSSATNFPKNPPRIASNAPSKTPTKIPVPTKASDSKNKKTPAKNGKVQTKLNVTKVVNKMKGRVDNPPAPAIPAPKQEIVLSSGEESSTSEEPVWQTGNAKAGPSSRKPIFSVTASRGKETANAKPNTASQEKKTTKVKHCTPIDPVIRDIKVEKDKAAAPATLPRSTTKPDITSLQKSTSRSPAQALSETYSLSSGSASNSDSESEDEEEEELQARSSKRSTAATNGKTESGTVKGVSKAVDMGAKKSEGYLQSKAPSQPSQASSSRSRSTVSMHGDGKHANQAADKQLQLESRQSGPITNDFADKKVINQGLDHAGRLPNGTRPVWYKYPGLSELRKLPRAATPETEQNLDTFSSQPHGALPLRKSESDESSSDSDDSSSSSDEDEEVDGLSSQNSSKKKSGGNSGRRGLLKRILTRPW